MRDDQQDPGLVAVADVREFFRESLQAALEHQHLRVRDHTEHYVVNLLAMFARTDALFEPGPEQRSQLKPLALLLAEAVEAPDEPRRRSAPPTSQTTPLDPSAPIAAPYPWRPVKPIRALVDDYPGLDISAFGLGVTPEHMTWYGVLVNGVNYLGGSQTRFGIYPYCESMRAASFSTSKSAFVSVALMRLAQQYSPAVADLLIRDYVPGYASSPGDWERVTFNHALDMSTGNYVAAGFMADDDSPKMGEFFGAQPYSERIKEAFSAPYKAEPGTLWVYRTSDTFILTRAMHNYLRSQSAQEGRLYWAPD